MAKKNKESTSKTNEVLEYHLTDDYYDSLYVKIIDYLTSGKVHSTLVGIMINLDGDQGGKDVIEAKIFADYIINFLKKVN